MHCGNQALWNFDSSCTVWKSCPSQQRKKSPAGLEDRRMIPTAREFWICSSMASISGDEKEYSLLWRTGAWSINCAVLGQNEIKFSVLSNSTSCNRIIPVGLMKYFWFLIHVTPALNWTISSVMWGLCLISQGWPRIRMCWVDSARWDIKVSEGQSVNVRLTGAVSWVILHQRRLLNSILHLAGSL